MRLSRPALSRTTVAGITMRAVAMQRTRSMPEGGWMPVSPSGVPCGMGRGVGGGGARARVRVGGGCALPVLRLPPLHLASNLRLDSGAHLHSIAHLLPRRRWPVCLLASTRAQQGSALNAPVDGHGRHTYTRLEFHQLTSTTRTQATHLDGHEPIDGHGLRVLRQRGQLVDEAHAVLRDAFWERHSV